MPKTLWKKIALFSTILFIYGCQTPGVKIAPVKVRGYIEDKKRVDQEFQGNAGYLSGGPSDEARQQWDERRKTRKIYVLEMTKEEEEVIEKQDFETVDKRSQPLVNYERKPVKRAPKVAPPPEIVIPSFDDEGFIEEESYVEPNLSSFVEYKVEKNDTLQKISKKFYDSYSKWPRIYDANKHRIKNPEQIKPGITIRIPME